MKKKVYIIVIVIILLLCGLLLMKENQASQAILPGETPPLQDSSVQRQPVLSSAESTVALVYYASADGKKIVPVSRRINATNEVAAEALALLLAGPPSEIFAASVPEGTKLLGLYSIYQTVYVDLSAEFLDISKEQMQMAVDAICATVLPLTDGYKLQILVEGKGYAMISGVHLEDPLSMPDLNAEELPAGYTKADCFAQRYYLPDTQGRYLIPYTMFLAAENAATELRILAVVERILPRGLELENIQTEDEVCTLNLGYEPNNNYVVSQSYEQAWLEAMCRSLCRIGGVSAIAINLNGALAQSLPQGTACVAPIVYDTPINLYE